MTSKKKTSYAIDMCSGPVLRKMLIFALPLMASSILQLLFNAADVIVVGKFAGDNSLAAVGSNSSLISLLVNFFLGLSVGVNVLVSRYFGGRDSDNIRETVHTAMTVSLVSGIFLTLLGSLIAKPVLTAMQAPKEILPLAVTYLRIYFLGMTATMVYNFGAAILRAVGDTRRSLYYLTAAGIINVLLNLFFVIVMKLDVAGVAAATVISQCVSAFLILRCLIREKSDIHLDLRSLKINGQKLFRILQIGLPAGLQSVLFCFANVMIQASINSFGPAVVAGSSAASNLEGFIYVAMNASYQSTLSFVSQNMGAGKHDRVMRILLCGQVCVIVTGILMGTVWVQNGRTLLTLYTSSPEVIEEGMKRMIIVAGPYFICGMMDVMVGALRGLGYSAMPMIVSLVGACGLRLAWIATGFRTARFHTVRSLYMTYPASWTVTLLAHVVCFVIVWRRLQRKWTRYGHVRYL